MTQPIQEPTTQRSISMGQWGERQLYRRPAPVSGAAIPWVRRSKGFDASNQTINTATITALTFNHDYNFAAGETGETWFTTSGTSQIDLTGSSVVAGDSYLYLVTAEVMWDSGSNFDFWLGISDSISGAAHWSSHSHTNFSTLSYLVSMHHRWTDDAGLRLQVLQQTGVGQDVDACYLEVHNLGPSAGDVWTSMNPDQ